METWERVYRPQGASSSPAGMDTKAGIRGALRPGALAQSPRRAGGARVLVL